MTTLITLQSAGVDAGPFELYSDIDNFAAPVVSGITRSELLAGYSTTLIPDNAVTVRVQSTGNCVNSIDITVDYPVTTTTTTTTQAVVLSGNCYTISVQVADMNNGTDDLYIVSTNAQTSLEEVRLHSNLPSTPVSGGNDIIICSETVPLYRYGASGANVNVPGISYTETIGTCTQDSDCANV